MAANDADRADGLEELGAAPWLAAHDLGFAVDVAVRVDLTAAQELGQLRHGAVGHGKAVDLVHDDRVGLLRVHADDATHALDASRVRALGVGAVLALVIPAVALLAAPGAGALLLAAGRIGRVGLLERFRLDDRIPLVVELTAAGDGLDVGDVVGMACGLVVLVAGLLGGRRTGERRSAEENRNVETDHDERGRGRAQEALSRGHRRSRGFLPLFPAKPAWGQRSLLIPPAPKITWRVS